MSRGLHPSQDIDVTRTLVEAYTRLRHGLESMRAETTLLPDLLAIATVSDEVEDSLARYSKRLRQLEAKRHHQARTATVVADLKAMAQGCAALAPGAGAPLASCPGGDITSTGDRLSFSPEGQELPRPGMHADNRNVEGVAA